MAKNMHEEAQRRQRHMDRVCEARRKMASTEEDEQVPGTSFKTSSAADPLMCTDQGQFYQTRIQSQPHALTQLTPFRVNQDGHRNRYRNRQHLAPHCDSSYTLIYPGSDNDEYCRPQTRKNRRENSFIDSYEITKKVNGEFHMQGRRRAD
ncbi:hypothetical protein EGW08_016190 [Elysia chlorotica]|uniref:Uncharacterized protein n=1 Tax=Elysia chlorotica TaxID=188477 RepID=A0A3S1HBN4_ELYCH|nr:hypothetical protein EGW08_016190 [Elysia chlorotica]